MRRQNLLLLLFLVVSAIVHATFLSRIDGAEPVVAPGGSEIQVTLLAPVPEPPVERTAPEEINVAPAPALPDFIAPFEESFAIPEEALPPMDPRHEIEPTRFDPSFFLKTPVAVRGNVATEEIVRGWLQRHKRYPRVAVLRRIEGEVMLYLRLDPAGKVLLCEIHESSGEAMLDDAVLDMVKRADPFPLMGNETSSETEYIVPIDFRLE